MTICLAALADNNKSLVLASDKEVTFGFPINTEIESDNKKIQKITNKIFVLIAGDALLSMELVEELKREMQGAQSVKEVADALSKKYIKLRQKTMSDIYLQPRGLNLEEYLAKQQTLNQQVVMLIEGNLTSDNNSFNVAFIIAGIDESDGNAHIYAIFPPGILRLMDINSYCAIGIGNIHAINSLISNRYSAKHSLREALYFVYEAKKRSEVAPGVGVLTDVITVTNFSTYQELSQMQIDEIDKIRMTIHVKLGDELKKQLESYKLTSKIDRQGEIKNAKQPIPK